MVLATVELGSIIHKSVYIRSRLHVCHYGLRFKITSQVALKVLVNCSVATSNDACMHGIRGSFLPCRIG